MAGGPRYIASALTAQRTPLPTVILLLRARLLLPTDVVYRAIAKQWLLYVCLFCGRCVASDLHSTILIVLYNSLLC
jgi:hypothetical protein